MSLLAFPSSRGSPQSCADDSAQLSEKLSALADKQAKCAQNHMRVADLRRPLHISFVDIFARRLAPLPKHFEGSESFVVRIKANSPKGEDAKPPVYGELS